MRVTAQVKLDTQQAILDAARKLFLKQGLQGTSTRAIAAAAKIGIGTLFNYYPSKESLTMAVAAGVFDQGREQSLARLSNQSRPRTLEEDLFTLVACDLRALTPIRSLVGEILEMGGGALGGGLGVPDGAGIRGDRIADAERTLAAHAMASQGSPAMMHLYWSLYLGVVSFWSRDTSPKQEDSLALLDQSVRMFAGAMKGAAGDARKD